MSISFFVILFVASGSHVDAGEGTIKLIPSPKAQEENSDERKLFNNDLIGKWFEEFDKPIFPDGLKLRECFEHRNAPACLDLHDTFVNSCFLELHSRCEISNDAAFQLVKICVEDRNLDACSYAHEAYSFRCKQVSGDPCEIVSRIERGVAKIKNNEDKKVETKYEQNKCNTGTITQQHNCVTAGIVTNDIKRAVRGFDLYYECRKGIDSSCEEFEQHVLEVRRYNGRMALEANVKAARNAAEQIRQGVTESERRLQYRNAASAYRENANYWDNEYNIALENGDKDAAADAENLRDYYRRKAKEYSQD